MPCGKLVAQAGHCYLQAFLRSPPESQAAYQADGVGTKVVLMVSDLSTLIRVEQDCHKLPHELIVDSGHLLPPHFTGAPIVTGLGLGPVTRAQLPRSVKRLPILGEEIVC